MPVLLLLQSARILRIRPSEEVCVHGAHSARHNPCTMARAVVQPARWLVLPARAIHGARVVRDLPCPASVRPHAIEAGLARLLPADGHVTAWALFRRQHRQHGGKRQFNHRHECAEPRGRVQSTSTALPSPLLS